MELTSKTKFVDCLYALSRTSGDHLGILVWAASLLMTYKKTPCISHSDVVKLA